jgi:hypothetical protein
VRENGGNRSPDFYIAAGRYRSVDAQVLSVVDLCKEDFSGETLRFDIICNIFNNRPGHSYGEKGRRDDPFRALIIEVKRVGIADGRGIIHGPAGAYQARVFFQGGADEIRGQFHKVAPFTSGSI